MHNLLARRNPLTRLGRLDSLFDLDKLFEIDDYYISPVKNFSTKINTNIYEDENSYNVEAVIPGVEKNNISISMKDNVLTISVKDETKEEDKNYIRKEIVTKSSSRNICFEKEIDEEKIEATYKNGILKLTMPKKKEEIKTTKIKIQ